MKASLFPGQGSQRKGMGAELFEKYPEYVKQADAILGYSIEELCLSDAENRLNFTAYTQPAIFVVSVLNYLEAMKIVGEPDVVAGHSIGEYAALFAAEAFDFATGLRIVQKRAELMSKTEGGGLAAVIGLPQDEVEARILASQLAGIEIANINSPTQIVIGARVETIQKFVKFSEGQDGRVVPLRVSGAFHTSYMREAQDAFRHFLEGMTFSPPVIPVISNYTTYAHAPKSIAANLANHLANPVRWTQCIENMVRAGVDTFTEIGSNILTPMVNDIRDHMAKHAPPPVPKPTSPTKPTSKTALPAFCTSFGFKKPMVAGSTGHRAIGVELVSSLSRNGVLAFLDTYGLSLPEIESALQSLAADPDIAGKYGVNLTFDADAHSSDDALIALCLRYGVRFLEVRGYFEPTAALLRYRSEGGLDDRGFPRNRIVLRVSEADAASPFMEVLTSSPAYEKTSGLIDEMPLIDAVCVDIRPWRSTVADGLAAFEEILDLCRGRQEARLPFGRIFIGLSGHAVTQRPVETALEKGADFALIGSAFLLAQEARLERSIRIELSNAAEYRFRETFDWAYPACRTASFGHVLHEQAAEQMAALQELYAQDGLDVAALRALSAQYADAGGPILPESFIDACAGMNKFEIRATIRERLRALTPHYFIACEAPFPDFTGWLHARDASLPVSAAKLADLIYSSIN